MQKKQNIPPRHLFKGKLGEELIVLSNSEVRVAERADRRGETCETLDGAILVEEGDFIVRTQEGEPYPIRPAVYFGTYEILGEMGKQFIGRRLVHERRAWPIESDGAEFDYGPNRGVAFAQKGGWIYQSDDDDFGLINKKVKEVSHTMVGSVKEMAGRDWILMYHSGIKTISLLTPVLALLALLAFAANLTDRLNIATSLLVLEGFLLLTGLILAWWMKSDRWALKAALNAGKEIATDFQVAVRTLGFPESNLFSGMALWRAAQSDEQPEPDLSPENILHLKEVVNATIEKSELQIIKNERAESLASLIGWASASAILFCIVISVITHDPMFEALAIWLPAVVGTVHASAWRRQVMIRVAANQLFQSQLIFARKELNRWTNAPHAFDGAPTSKVKLAMITRTLCKAAARHSQTQITVAMSQHPTPPA